MVISSGKALGSSKLAASYYGVILHASRVPASRHRLGPADLHFDLVYLTRLLLQEPTGIDNKHTTHSSRLLCCFTSTAARL